MRIGGTAYRTIWETEGGVAIIDQRRLPFQVTCPTITSAAEMVCAIREMWVRGAPLIGVAGAYAVVLAAQRLATRHKQVDLDTLLAFHDELEIIANARPTAINLRWAVEKQKALVALGQSWAEVVETLRSHAAHTADADVAACSAIGEHGLAVLREIHARKRDPNAPLKILTHCNAGWLATIDRGTALAPVYAARDAGIPVFVWVDETRPRLQGAKLTAFELAEEQIDHAVIADNAGGHLMQQGEVDVCIVGTDRVARNGDVANKIGTYLKALAAFDNQVPFYVAAPSSSIDWECNAGASIPIEERAGSEVAGVEGLAADGSFSTVRIVPHSSPVVNHGFDVTPARLVTGLITERGVVPASEAGLRTLFPEKLR